MKKSDLASLILIISISFTLAYLIGNAIFNSPESRSTEVEFVNPYETEIITPSQDIFNENSINPAEQINIDEETTDNPFVEE